MISWIAQCFAVKTSIGAPPENLAITTGAATDAITLLAPADVLEGDFSIGRKAGDAKPGRQIPNGPSPPLTQANALRLPAPNRGLVFVEENLGVPNSRAMSVARDFESGTTGAYSNVHTRNRVGPALRFDNSEGRNLVRFDGFEAVQGR